MLQKDINLYVISGFLGSGKTTFLKNMLENFEGKKVGVLINEFGRIGIDGRLVEKEGIELVEINNGSIYCSCLKGSFINALIELSKTDIELLLIENSGMADPSNMHNILDELNGKTARKYNYKGAVCIVDSISFLKHVKVLAPVQNQIASSNLIIINKIDMVNQATITEIEKAVREINPHAFLYKTIYSKVPISIMEENLTDSGYVGKTSNEPSNRPATYSLECQGSFCDQDILKFIHCMKDYAFRIKGIVKDNNLWWQVDVVGDDIKVGEFSLTKRDVITISKLVVIGKDTKDFKEVIIKSWEEIFHVKPQVFSDYDLCQ